MESRGSSEGQASLPRKSRLEWSGGALATPRTHAPYWVGLKTHAQRGLEADTIYMIQEEFFDSLLTFINSEQALTRYAMAREARQSFTAYDERAIEAERVRNLALLSHAWSTSTPAQSPAEI